MKKKSVALWSRYLGTAFNKVLVNFLYSPFSLYPLELSLSRHFLTLLVLVIPFPDSAIPVVQAIDASFVLLVREKPFFCVSQ